MDTTPNLGLPYLAAAQSQKHVTHNEAIRALDALIQLSVVSRAVGTPPAVPPDGARYLVATAAGGTWAGHSLHVAAWQDGAWTFFVPRNGWLAYVADEATLCAFDGTAWSPVIGSVPQLGVNATADATNRLAVKSPASLFDNTGHGHQLKINKAAAADTASLLFQDAYSGRAEVGLAGDDALHVKVSADGTTWHAAVDVDPATGIVSFPSGIAAIPSSSIADATPAGRAVLTAANAGDQIAALGLAVTLPGVFNAATRPLPATGVAAGTRAAVSDATTGSFGAPYVSGGTLFRPVLLSTAAGWLYG